MSNRELLELAAKAAGYVFEWRAQPLILASPPDPERPWRCWNPLDDDGDALRLAVKAGISFGIGSDTGLPRIAWFMGGELHTRDMPENKVTQLTAAEADLTVWVRWAICVAAAEIGRGMV